MLSRKARHLITTTRDDNLLLFPRGRPQDQEGQKPMYGQRAPTILLSRG